MSLFQKCDNLTLVKETREKGIYPYFHQSPLSNLYLTLYLFQVGIFKEIQHYRYRCYLMCIPL